MLKQNIKTRLCVNPKS